MYRLVCWNVNIGEICFGRFLQCAMFMEGREGDYITEILKKSKSLDLKSFYESELKKQAPDKRLKRVDSGSGNGDEKRNKKKKARKEVSLSNLENADGCGKKIVDTEGHKGLHSGGQDLHEWKLWVSKRLCSSGGLNKVSFIVDGDVVRIPKRKRSFLRRKTSEFGQAPNLGAGQPKLDGDDFSRGLGSSKTEQKDEFKENSSDSNLVQHVRENEDCISHSVVNSGDSSLTKSRRKHRKRKALASDRVRVSKEAKPLIGSCKVSDDLQDDEENLEENAARMLSSRFDPSCTGISSSSKSSTLSSANGFPVLLSSSQIIVNCGLKNQSCSESALVVTDGRILRHRKQNKEKGSLRKRPRRHFYEILLPDVNADWVVNRRIKVFWPLDQIWYYGSVNDYDKEKKLHHIKYDDRDEEWIDLRMERFKLLLLYSEVPGNARGKRALAKSRTSEQQNRSKTRKEIQKRGAIAEDVSFSGSGIDSEPIISWLARSYHLHKSSHFNGSKRQKTSATSPNTTSSLLYDEPVKVKGHLANSSPRDVKNNLSSDSVSKDKLGNNCMKESSLYNDTCNKDEKHPVVYVRRYFQGRSQISPHMPLVKHVNTSAPCSLPFDEDVKDSSASRVEVIGPLHFTWDAGVSKVFWDMESAILKFNLNVPLFLVLNDCLKSDNLWLVYAVLLPQYGTVMTMCPRVCLEMLFVDNVVGLRFLLFEGCLKMAASLVSLVLRVFHQSAYQGKYTDLQLPVTSIGFKFSSVHISKQPHVFALYNFSGVNSSKWRYLDSKLKRHCLLSKQLHLSECTYDNIQALQNESIRSSISMASDRKLSSAKVMRSRPGINGMGVSKVSTQVDIHLSLSAGNRKLPPLALSFSAAPTFFLSLHLKLLMEQSAANVRFCDRAPIIDVEDSGLVMHDCSSKEDFSNRNSENHPEKDMMTLSKGVVGDRWSGAEFNQVICPSAGSYQNLSQNYEDIGCNGAGTSVSHGSGSHDAIHLPEWQSHDSGLEVVSLPKVVYLPLIQEPMTDVGSHSFVGDLTAQIPSKHQFGNIVDDDFHGAQDSPDFSWNIHRGLIRSPNPTAPKSSWHWNRNSSSSFGFQSRGWSDGKADSLYSDLRNGPKRPHTQVSYSLPFPGNDISSRYRSHHLKGLPHKRIRKAKEKKSAEVARGCEKNFECISCKANVLITLGNKGWRESGAHVVLEVYEHNDWKLSVKLSGITKYSYKAHQFLQPGSTNRYTDAMMWKGEKDWALEFLDRSQWTLFKEMHEECYNRNIRAASVKSIPIPGVHLIEENDDHGPEVTFVRSCKYIRQIETDVERALNPSRVLYDMDSEDEELISTIRNFAENHSDLNEISEDMFEKGMDTIEKVAYTKKFDQFTPNEIEELMVDFRPSSVVKIICDHWEQRRRKKGMALIRHFQPPLWERYQQQLKEWEAALIKNRATSDGFVDKAAILEKPLMFAFCMKPRGLEQQNKVYKHRSQKRIPVSGYTNSILDHDGIQTFGRRPNGFAIGDDKFVYHGYSFDSFDDSPLPQTSPRVFSSREAGSMRYHSIGNEGYYRNHNPKIWRSKSKKLETFNYHNDSRIAASYSRNMSASGKRNGASSWNMMGCYELPGHWPDLLDGLENEQWDGSDLDEYRLHDAMSAAQHARKIAKFLRQRAQRLHNIADLAIHRAVVALMTAEAMKALEDSVDESSNAPMI